LVLPEKIFGLGRSAIGFGAAVVVGCVLLVILRDDWLSLDRALLSVAIICLGCVPGTLYISSDPAKRPPLPLMALAGLFYAVFFGLPAFLADQLIYTPVPGEKNPFAVISGLPVIYEFGVIEEISLMAQFFILIGMALMFGAWSFGRAVLFKRLPALAFGHAGPDKNPDWPVLATLVGLLALSNLAYWTIPEIRGLPSVGQFLIPAGAIAFGAFYLMFAAKVIPKWLSLAYFFVLLPLWVGTLASHGFLTPIMLLACLWLALRIYSNGKIPWISLVSAVLIFIWMYPHLNEFRTEYWGANKGQSATEKVVAYANILLDRTFQGQFGTQHINEAGMPSPSNKIKPFQGIVQRISFNLLMSHVVDNTPNPIPYWEGTSYRSLMLSWVPRVIWKTKPEERWGNEFGRRYQLLTTDNTYMSLNLPWLVELYANFGAKGVVLGMTLIGLFMAFLERLLSRNESDLVSKGIGAAVLLPLFNQESNFTLMTGSLIPLILCLWVYFYVPTWFLLKRRKSQTMGD
jgi:hypothetical protein